MDISICSYSFHRLLAAGKQDIYRYITDCKELGCTQLDAWNGHFPEIAVGDKAATPDQINSANLLSAQEEDYIASIKAASDMAGIPFGALAVDGAHIYEADEDARKANRVRAYRWIEIGSRLGAKQMRIDSGGPAELTDEMFAIIKEGYADIIGRAKAKGIQIIIENHWGSSSIPDNVVRFLEGIPGLGYLFDTHNWADGYRDEGRVKTAKYATATHVKTFAWDDAGHEIGDDAEPAIQLLLETGYKGSWGIESVPRDGDEYGSAAKSVALIKRMVAA
jgi:sugar phosphate isomerase/epimerase